MGCILLHSHNTKTTTWLDPRLCKKAKAPEDCEDGGEIFRIHLSPLIDKCLSLSELDKIHYWCDRSFFLRPLTLWSKQSIALSVHSEVAIGVNVRLGKTIVYFPWSSGIWLNHGYSCIPEQRMVYFVPISIIAKEKAGKLMISLEIFMWVEYGRKKRSISIRMYE